MTPEQKLRQQQAAARTLQSAATGPTSTMGLGTGQQDPTKHGYNGREDDVGTIAGQMMGKDSRLMQKAAATGVQFASRRGLGNSTLAGQASQSAMLDQIVPMAGQTAGQQFQKNLSGQKYGEGLGAAAQDARLKAGLMEREGQISRRSDAFKSGLETDRMKVDADLKSELMRTQSSLTIEEGRFKFAQDRFLQNDKQSFDRARADADNALKMQLQRVGMKGERQQAASNVLNNAFNDYEQSQQSILSNTKLPAEERNKLLENSKKMLENKINYVSKLYGGALKWPANPFRTNSPAQKPAAGKSPATKSPAKPSSKPNPRVSGGTPDDFWNRGP